MFSKLKSYASQSDALCRNLTAEIGKLKSEGRSNEWTLKKVNEATETARQANRHLQLEMKIETAGLQNEAKEYYLGVWQGDNQGVSSGAEKAQWRSLAQNCFKGRSPEEAIEIYERQVDRMTTTDKKKYRHIFDQELEIATYGDPVKEHMAGKAVDKHRSQEEREAKKDFDMSRRTGEFLGTLTAQFDMNLDGAEKGEAPLETTSIVDGIEKNVTGEFYGVE